MSKKKILLTLLFIAIVIPVLVYIVMSSYLSFKSAELIDSSWSNDGILPENIKETISEKDYSRLFWARDTDADNKAYRIGDKYAGETIGEIYLQHTIPITVYKFNTAITYYHYTGRFYSENGNLICASGGDGLEGILCKIYWEFQNGKWVVTQYWEHI